MDKTTTMIQKVYEYYNVHFPPHGITDEMVEVLMKKFISTIYNVEKVNDIVPGKPLPYNIVQYSSQEINGDNQIYAKSWLTSNVDITSSYIISYGSGTTAKIAKLQMIYNFLISNKLISPLPEPEEKDDNDDNGGLDYYYAN